MHSRLIGLWPMTVAVAGIALACSPSSLAQVAAKPWVLNIERVVVLAPPEWDVLTLQQLESQLVNAPTEEVRCAKEAEIQALRERMDSGRAVVLLGRAPSAARNAKTVAAAALVPAGMGGTAVSVGSAVRITPSAQSWPGMSLGEAGLAYPALRTFGTAEHPGVVASAIEVLSPSSDAASSSTGIVSSAPSPWARESPTALEESSNLVVEGPPLPGPITNRWVPMNLVVRNSGKAALPACEVFFEFSDSTGNLIHREFRWVTPQRTAALEAHLPPLASGQTAPIQTLIPESIAAQATTCRVLILRALPSPGR